MKQSDVRGVPPRALPCLSPACRLQPAASAALYAQLVQGKKGAEAVEALGKLLAHLEQNLSRRGSAYLAGVSGCVGRGQPLLPGGAALDAACPTPGLAPGGPDPVFLAQATRSVADVVVWGTLFPVLQDEASLPSKSDAGVRRGSAPRVPAALSTLPLSLSILPKVSCGR